MAISIKCIPITAERFKITVSLILLRYTVVRTAVRSRVPRYGFCRRYPTLHWVVMFLKVGDLTAGDHTVIAGMCNTAHALFLLIHPIYTAVWSDFPLHGEFIVTHSSDNLRSRFCEIPQTCCRGVPTRILN